jgi:hypothetical protein
MSIAFAALIFAATTIEPSQNNIPAGLPLRLENYLRDSVRITADQHRQLLRGAPITKLLDVDESKEVAVVGAVWINGSVRRYVDAAKDIENFENGGGFKVTKRISEPPRLEDFAELRLPDKDIADLPMCRVGDCEVKLGEEALQRLHTEIDWKEPNAVAVAHTLIRKLALDYVTGYLAGGNDRLAVHRDKDRPTFVAQEFRAMVDQMPELTAYMPNIRSYLLGYPKVTLPGATSFLYWQETEFGLKPTIRISHLTIWEGQDETVLASKMLYASHYFWTGLELRLLIPDSARNSGFWFVTVSRSRSDGLSGFSGTFVRRRVRSEVQDGGLAALRQTKRMIERSR